LYPPYWDTEAKGLKLEQGGKSDEALWGKPLKLSQSIKYKRSRPAGMENRGSSGKQRREER